MGKEQKFKSCFSVQVYGLTGAYVIGTAEVLGEKILQ